MSEPTADAQLDEFLEIRKPGAHLEEGVVADDFVLMLGVDLHNYPKFAAGRRPRHLPEGGARHPPATRRRLRRRTARLQRPVPSRPSLHRLLQGRARYQVLALERPVHAAVRRRVGQGSRKAVRRRDDGGDRVGRVERSGRPRARAHEERVPARGPRLRRPEPARRGRGRPRHHARRLHRTVHARANGAELSKEAARQVVPRKSRVPAAVHRGVGRADRRALRTRRDVRHPVDAVGRNGPARREEAQGASTWASPGTPSKTG